MKFDLFDALNIMKRRFGSDSHITVFNGDSVVRVRLSVFKHSMHNTEFVILLSEISDANVGIMNIKFQSAVDELEHFLAEHGEAIK